MAHGETSGGLLRQLLAPTGARSRGAQRRAFPRWARAFPVLHEVAGIWVVGGAIDISEDGLRFYSTQSYAVDAEISFLLQPTTEASGWVRV